MRSRRAQHYGWKTEAVPASHRYLYGEILTVLDGRIPCSVLDLGCGNGFLAGLLAERGCDVVGVDADGGGIEIAARTYPTVRFIQADVTQLTCNDLSRVFDVVVASEVIEHLYDPEDFVKVARMFLKPDGRLILTTPYHGYLKNLLLSIVGRWDRHANPLWCGGHIKFWSARTLSRLLSENEFRITDWRGAGRCPYFWKSMIVSARLKDGSV